MEKNSNFLKPNEDMRNLQLLEEISRDSTASQRKLSERLGVALGVTNACLKKMAKKGYIKVKGINHKRISYFLTPEGFSEKTRLTYHFLEYTVHYYINLKKNLSEKLDFISKQGVKRVVFYGAGDVMEVAFVISNEANIELLGIVDDDKAKQGTKKFNFTIGGAETIRDLKPDAIIITSMRYKDEILKRISADEELAKIPVHGL
ncbi:MAG: winged helix-turn-helix transcriptional regulator [Candidatus Omnitrophica bacterium]|nr:winged helix-turn-helix transcriptional regulator [Candidatus Omnitrophota bacterium]